MDLTCLLPYEILQHVASSLLPRYQCRFALTSRQNYDCLYSPLLRWHAKWRQQTPPKYRVYSKDNASITNMDGNIILRTYNYNIMSFKIQNKNRKTYIDVYESTEEIDTGDIYDKVYIWYKKWDEERFHAWLRTIKYEFFFPSIMDLTCLLPCEILQHIASGLLPRYQCRFTLTSRQNYDCLYSPLLRWCAKGPNSRYQTQMHKI